MVPPALFKSYWHSLILQWFIVHFAITHSYQQAFAVFKTWRHSLLIRQWSTVHLHILWRSFQQPCALFIYHNMSLVEWLFKIFSVLLWLAAYQWLCFVHGGHQVFQPLRGHGPDCCPYHHAQCFWRWVVWFGTSLCLLCWLFSRLLRKSIVVQQMRGHPDERLLITIMTVFSFWRLYIPVDA